MPQVLESLKNDDETSYFSLSVCKSGMSCKSHTIFQREIVIADIIKVGYIIAFKNWPFEKEKITVLKFSIPIKLTKSTDSYIWKNLKKLNCL